MSAYHKGLATWNRIAGLSRVRRAVEAATVLGAGRYRYDNGSPCCALGHALVGFSRQSTWADLGISIADVDAIVPVNDNTPRALRRERVLAVVRERIALALKPATSAEAGAG